MTREEILNTPEIVDFMIDKSVMVDSKMKLHKRLEELCKLAIKALEIQACKPNGDDWESYADRLYELAYQHGQGDKEPCEDCISRAEAIKETEKLLRGNYDAEYIVETLKTLPPVTPKAEQKAILDKITAEIWEEAEWAYSDFDEYKEIVLETEPDELPDDEFRFGLHRAVEIINKYKAESEDKG